MSGNLTVLCRTIADFSPPPVNRGSVTRSSTRERAARCRLAAVAKASICGRPTVLPAAYPYCERMSQVGGDCRLVPYEAATLASTHRRRIATVENFEKIDEMGGSSTRTPAPPPPPLRQCRAAGRGRGRVRHSPTCRHAPRRPGTFVLMFPLPTRLHWDFRFARPGWPLYTPKGSVAHETLVRHSIVPLQRPSAQRGRPCDH